MSPKIPGKNGLFPLSVPSQKVGQLVYIQLLHVEDLQGELFLLLRQDVRRLDRRLDGFLDILLINDRNSGLRTVTDREHSHRTGGNTYHDTRGNGSFPNP